jgi:hypothetical protein
MANLIEVVQNECARLRETVIPKRDDQGYIRMVNQTIKRADAAIAANDTLRQAVVYQELQDLK